MTTQNVSELSSMFTVQSATNVAQSSKATASGASFSEMYDKAKNTQQPETGKTDKSSEDFKGRSGEVVNEPDRRRENADASVRSTDDKGSLKDLDRDEVGDKVVDATDKITAKLKEQLDVTDEDIQNAMETLGFTMVDLLNTDNLKEVYTELSPADDALSLITNEELYSGLQDITQMASDLTDQLKTDMNLTDDQFDQMINDLKDESVDGPEIFGNENIQLNAEASGQKEASQDIQTKIPVEVIKDDRKAVSDESKPLNQEVNTQESTEVQVDKEVKSEKHEDHSGQNDNQFSPFSQQQNAFGIQEPAEGVLVEDVSYSTYTDTEEIAKQIIDQIKVKVTEETTQLEMELNPASLGKVGLQIEAKNGVITAQFTAQDEAVKSAIESQLLQLQENLDKQGVRVEAVEVTIASHEFEQNLQQESGKDSKDQELEKAQAVSRRRRLNINLDEELDEDSDDELTEEEIITRDMMRRSGNSVDFTA